MHRDSFATTSDTRKNRFIGRRRRLRGLRRRGVMAVLIALILVVFLVAIVFMVDVGYMQLARVQLRAATDASARAAAEALSRTQSLEDATITAKAIAANNLVAGAPLVLADEDIVFGNSARQPQGSWAFTANATPVNSVRVLGRRTQDAPSGPVRLFFGSILGRGTFEPRQFATVIRLDRDVCLVVDRSSSMKLFLTETAPGMSSSDERFCHPPDADESRWSALVAAIDEFLYQLGNTPQTEYVGLASYASNSSYCEYSNTQSAINQVVTSDSTLVSAAIADITNSVFNGGTNITAGVNEGVAALTDATTTRPFAAKTMVLFTDGHATEGGDPVVAAQNAAQQNIIIHTVTFGGGANQIDMRAVAEATGGNHYHAPDAETLKVIFREVALTLPIVFTE